MPSSFKPSLTLVRTYWAARCVALLLLYLAPVLGTLALESPPSAGRDFTFFLFSDVHIGAEDLKANPPVTQEDSLARAKANLNLMRGLVGQPYPARPEFAGLDLGSIATPRALIILGDLTDGHKEPDRQEQQWISFETLFPARGVSFGDQKVPVFASAGNHDGEIVGPQRRGLVKRNREFNQEGRISAISTNGVHFALNWNDVHFVNLGLCPADTTDVETPFKYGKTGPGSWNDPQGGLAFLKDYLSRNVGSSGQPVFLMHHYGFDGFSLNDWNWWTLKQRRDLYVLLQKYNVAAIFHGHNHHAEHYRWPDPQFHAGDLNFFFNGKLPADYRQYDVLSCGNLCWIIRIRGERFIAAHYTSSGSAAAPGDCFTKSLKP